jgi:hypothetical protein
VVDAAPPLLGVLKRFRAFASVVPPACVEAALPDEPLAAVPLLDGVPVEAVEDDPVWAEEDVSAVELEVEEVEDELPCPDARNVGLLEIAPVVAREAEGSAEFGPRRLPRNCGTTSAAKRSGAVVPVSRMVRSSGADATRSLRIAPCWAPAFLVSEPAARSIHVVHAAAAASAITAQSRRVRRTSGSREP